jgi:hypothetical protein
MLKRVRKERTDKEIDSPIPSKHESREFERLSVATGQGETRPHTGRNWILAILENINPF